MIRTTATRYGQTATTYLFRTCELIMNKRKKSKATLFNLQVFLNENGDIELETQSVDPEVFIKTMEAGMPSYEATYKVASLIRYLKSINDEIYERSGRYV